jgi:hypothetical protein
MTPRTTGAAFGTAASPRPPPSDLQRWNKAKPSCSHPAVVMSTAKQRGICCFQPIQPCRLAARLRGLSHCAHERPVTAASTTSKPAAATKGRRGRTDGSAMRGRLEPRAIVSPSPVSSDQAVVGACYARDGATDAGRFEVMLADDAGGVRGCRFGRRASVNLLPP